MEFKLLQYYNIMDVIDIILRKHNYSIMKVKKDILYIIKNEHGTY